MFRRWIVSALAAALTFVAAALGISMMRGDAAPTHRAQPGNLIVIGMPGLSWSDIDEHRTPALWQMSQHAAVGNQLVRAISAHSCSSAAWVTLGAGARTPMGYGPPMAPESGTNDFCPPPVTGVADVSTHTYRYPQWSTWAADALKRNIPSRMGLVASTLEADGQCVSAVGQPATLAAANRRGVVGHYYPTVASADFDACPVTFVALGGRSDTQLQQVLDAAPIDTTFLVTGLTDDERPEAVRTVMLDGPTVGSGMLRSRSTRQRGLVATTDLSAFVLERVAHPPTLGEGRPLSIEQTSTPAALRSVRHLQILLRVEHNLITPFFTWAAAISGVLLTMGAGLSVWSRRVRARPRALVAGTDAASTGSTGAGSGHVNDMMWQRRCTRGWWAMTGAVMAAVPGATFLVNLYAWYLHEHVLVWLGGCVVAIALPVAVLALAGPWRRWTPGPAVFLAVFTATTLALDAVEGSPLQLVSVLGLQPVYGGRFSGMGNVGYALFMTSCLFAAAMLAGRYRAMKRPRLALLTVIAIGVPAIAVNGVPQWGNEGGGSAAFVPAIVYLAMRARGWRITLTRLVLSALAGAGFVFVVGWLDYLRGETARTHLGDVFAGLIGDGQVNPFKRILYANWQMLNSQPINLLVPAWLVFSFAVLVFPNGVGRFLKPLLVRVPMMRHGLIAITIMLTAGFLANDSGTSIPAAGAIVIIPLLIVTSARHASPMTREAPRVPAVGRLGDEPN